MKYLILIALILFCSSCTNNKKFNSKLWKKSGGENITLETRSKMVNDLIESKTLLNKTENEIIELIGQPTRLANIEFDSIRYFQVQEVYGWNIDPEYMTFIKVIFNKKNKAKEVEFYKSK